MAKELQPTYGNFNLRGTVVWKNRNNAYVEDESKNGNPYRRIRFGVKTSEKNIVQVELFQTKFNEVVLQNKETKERDKRVKYGDHHDLPEGYKLFMPVNLGLEQDENENNIKKQLIPYDAIEYINNNLEDGDTVFMFGSPRFSEFQNREGDTISQVAFEPRGIYKSSINYDDEGFEGQSTFDQDMIINKTEKQGNRLLINAYIVTDKKGNFVPHSFYIDIDKYKKFAMNVHKLKFGTKLSVEGIIHHTVEEEEIEQSDGWGESPVRNTITNIKRELEITKAKEPSKEDIGMYDESDFVKEQKENESNPFEDKDSGNEWGESESSDGLFDSDSVDNNPFNDSDDDDDPFA